MMYLKNRNKKKLYQLYAAHYAETSPNRWRTSEHSDMNTLINAKTI